jgi:hypothetical protein
MEKTKIKVTVADTQTGQILFECAPSEQDKAYHYAAQMEEMGLDVKVTSPTLNESLAQSLGLGPEAMQRYQGSLQEEIEHHDGSCCYEDIDKNIN